MKQNLTVSLDKELIKRLRVMAAKRSSSISRMLSEELQRLVDEAQQYERAKKRALSALESGFKLGGKPARRDELHER